MIELTHGNLLTAPVDALVNTVNTEGVMGKGIALQFKQAFPQMHETYLADSRAGRVRLGHMNVVDLGALVGGPRWIINFPTKGHWRSKSRIEDIEGGLQDLVRTIKRLGIGSVALPPLGCGNGGLDWPEVRKLIEAAFEALPDVRVLLFPPLGAPSPGEMPTHTGKPKMTVGRATLIGLMRRYQQALLDPFVSLLEVHKLMYFLQEAGQPLRLQYEASTFGPYATNLRQVLIRLEGHWLSGYGDGADVPDKPLEIIQDGAEEAELFLTTMPEVRERMGRVAKLIEGFEDAYGMELLSTMHWVICHDVRARDSEDVAIARVQAWNLRKRKLFKPEHLRMAWKRLKEMGWDTESRSALH